MSVTATGVASTHAPESTPVARPTHKGDAMLDHKPDHSRQLKGFPEGPEGRQPTPIQVPNYRETGEDNPFRDVTQLHGDEGEMGDIRFDSPGPNVLALEREIEHTSKTR